MLTMHWTLDSEGRLTLKWVERPTTKVAQPIKTNDGREKAAISSEDEIKVNTKRHARRISKAA